MDTRRPAWLVVAGVVAVAMWIAIIAFIRWVMGGRTV